MNGGLVLGDCRLTLFGPPQVLIDGSPVTGLRRKSLALLSYLAVENRPVARDALAALFWPESGGDSARLNLRTCLHQAVHHLPPNSLVCSGDSIRLNPSIVSSDLADFQSIAPESADADRMMSCCQAGFLEGFSLGDCPGFDEWQTSTSQYLCRHLAGLLEQSILRMIAEGRSRQAVPACRRLIALDPLEESSHRMLMRTWAAHGLWSAAEDQYMACRDLLMEELGATPDEETEALARAVVERDESLRTDRRESVSPIPLEPDAFFGREEELRTIEALFSAGTTRLITLCGPAGAGKTRLAIHAAHRLTWLWPQGTTFVDLSDVTLTDAVIPAIASAVGMREPAGGRNERLEVLARHLNGRRMLVLVDNFEHVLPSASQIGRLLAVGTDFCVMVTSREPLEMPGEILLPVQPLGTDEHGSALAGSGAAALNLFEDRARAAVPTFRLTPENTEAVQDVCRLLDGLPLAIELAVPLLKVYSLNDLRKRLTRPLELLCSNCRSTHARHGSLSTAIDWSYRLLSAEERILFSGLSVFADGFDLPAVEAVFTGIISGHPVRQVLQSLVSGNLVRSRISRAGGSPVFGLLFSMKEFAAAHADNPAVTAVIRRQHAEYYSAFAAASGAGLHGPDQLQCTGQLDEARDNVHAALDYLMTVGRYDDGLDMANHLSWYWYRSGRFDDGRKRLKVLVEAVGPVPAIRRVRGLHNCGWLTFILGDWRSAHALHGECLWLSREIGDSAGECLALSDLGVIERWLGNEGLGWEYALASVDTARSLAEPETLLRSLVWAYSTTGGRFTGKPAVEELKEAVNLARSTGDEWMLSHAFNGLGDLFCEIGELNRAETAYRNSLAGFLRLGDRYLAAWNCEGLGRTCWKAGRNEEALEHTMSALEMFDSLGNELDVAVMLARIVDIGREAGRPGDDLALLAGAASAMLDRVIARHLSDAPQVEEALSTVRAYAEIEPVEYLIGRTTSRAAAVEAAKRFTGGHREARPGRDRAVTSSIWNPHAGEGKRQ